ncbi:hypothetical protein G4G28_07000 [Massilia sp. Dwa41.01b]|uniref:hypothetical protein n=1 Tax=unclassified Massilia TaxID=2609279 RepID=UPI0015FEC22A|nr:MULTISPECIES: hypothetical protein [unclassified Massilia]QNA88312.1 hypothetical protein G4G28_07000 [Massilia sp. Dwa41.01b]QNA99213.1 hypothetical protein G4G31_10710 [Massilia sp. Se16.2.3]
MNDEFENALAWFCSAPAQWIKEGRNSLAAGAEWIWEVLQGDFNDSASTAQVVTGTIISMIPFVDQLCDVRDLVANCKKLDEEPSQKWHWFTLALTLIGLIPGLGSLLKGSLKVMFAGMRKAGAVSGVTPRLSLHLDEAIVQLNRFLARPEIVAALKAMKWDNPHRLLAIEVKKLAAKVNTTALIGAFDHVAGAGKHLLGLVTKWGGSTVASHATDLIRKIDQVRQGAHCHLTGAVGPIRNAMEALARRLEIQADMAHRAYLNSVNPHAFAKVSEAEELAAFNKGKPAWVDRTPSAAYPQVAVPPNAPPGWTSTVSGPKRGRHPLNNAHETFNTIQALTIPPGTKLYRIVDPTSFDNSICWMSESEFKKLKSKDDWRRRFAVWANWNSNGEFVVYTVPPGSGLKVWEGVTASQRMEKTDFVLEGGARQIVVDPSHMDKSHLSPRQKTGWGYDDLGTSNSLVGVPVQRNHVR